MSTGPTRPRLRFDEENLRLRQRDDVASKIKQRCFSSTVFYFTFLLCGGLKGLEVTNHSNDDSNTVMNEESKPISDSRREGA